MKRAALIALATRPTCSHLQTEPWLLTLDRQGRAARMEGSSGVNAFRDTVEAALRR